MTAADRRRFALAAITALACALSPRPAAALRCTPIAGGSTALAELDAEARLRFVQESLRHSAHRARVWSWTWASLYSTSAVVNLVVTPWRSGDSRIDGYVSAGSAVLGVGAIVVRPLAVMRDQRELDAQVAGYPPGGDRCALLREAERRLLRDASNEASGKGPFLHVAGVVYNVAVAVTMSLALQHYEYAGIFLGSGIIVNEVQIATQPADLVGALTRYRQGVLSTPSGGPVRDVAIVPVAGAQQLGFAVTGRF